MKRTAMLLVSGLFGLVQQGAGQERPEPWDARVEGRSVDFFDLGTILATASSLDFDTLPWHGDEQYLVFEEFGRLVVGPVLSACCSRSTCR